MIKNVFIIFSVLAAVNCHVPHARPHPSGCPAPASIAGIQTLLPGRPPYGNLLPAAAIPSPHAKPLPLLQPPCAKSLPLPIAGPPYGSPLPIPAITPPCTNSLPIPIVTPPCANLPLPILPSPYEISLPKAPILGAPLELPVSLSAALPITSAAFELALPVPLAKSSCICREVPVPKFEIPLAIGNPFLPAASPVSALAPCAMLPPVNTCSRCQHLKKIPIPPPCI